MSDKTMLWRALSRDRGDSLVDRTHQCIPAWTSASCPCDARVVHAKRDNASNGTGSWSLTRASSSFSTATTATRARLLALAHSRGLDRWQVCHMVQVATLLLLLLLLESIRTKILHRDERKGVRVHFLIMAPFLDHQSRSILRACARQRQTATEI